MDILNSEFLLFLSCAQKNNLRYMLIGEYAMNYYGYNHNTSDMDVWLAPTTENKHAFIDTLLCMNYAENEVAALREEDFTTYFVGNIGNKDARIDILTIVHKDIPFDSAEKNKETFEISPGIVMNIAPYDFLKNIKLRAARPKDLFDIARLEKLRSK